ncbi:hypothetical protein HK098_007866, partial [Nowakowskiella sp. JEL0407]
GVGTIAHSTGKLFLSNCSITNNFAPQYSIAVAKILSVFDSVIDNHTSILDGMFLVNGGPAVFSNVAASRSRSGYNSLLTCINNCTSVTFTNCTLSNLQNEGAVMHLASGESTNITMDTTIFDTIQAGHDFGIFFQLEAIRTTDKLTVTISNSTLRNIRVNNGLVTSYLAGMYEVNIVNTEIDGLYAKEAGLLNFKDLSDGTRIKLDNVTARNIVAQNLIVLTTNGSIALRNCKFQQNQIKATTIAVSTNQITSVSLSLLNTEISDNYKTTPILLSGYNLNVLISNSKFTNNTLANYGGVFRFELSNSKITVVSSTFTNNHALYGGVFYFSGTAIPMTTKFFTWSRVKRRYADSEVEFVGNLFVDNRADFGGALFSDLDGFEGSRFFGNVYRNNTALMAGAVYYFPNAQYCPPSILQSEQSGTITSSPNTAIYDSFLASDPNKILFSNNTNADSIRLYSGLYLPLITVELVDGFGQHVITPTDYVSQDSLILMKMQISNINSTAEIIGGLCVVYNGKCIFHGQAYGIPGTYTLQISPIATKFTDLKSQTLQKQLTITDCPQELTSTTTSNSKFPICQPPICTKPCGKFGSCVSTNTCKCAVGYIGEHCDVYNMFPVPSGVVVVGCIIGCVVLVAFVLHVVVIWVFGRNSQSVVSADKYMLAGIFF